MSDIPLKDLIKVVGFDLDQTLYPKSPGIDEAIQRYIIERIAERKGVPADDADALFQDLYKAGAGLSGRKTLMALGFGEDEAAEVVQEALERADVASLLSPDPATTDLLERLAKRYRLDIVTGSGRENALRKLERLEIPRSLFCHIITADDGSKSDLTAFGLWLDLHTEFDRGEFLYVGDRAASDFEGPKSLGIRSVLVNVKADTRYGCPQFESLHAISGLLI